MDQVVSILLEHIKEQTGYMKQHTHLLTSINEQLAKFKLNACNLQQNKVEDEDDVKNGKGEQKVLKINEEVMCDSYVKQLHESPAPWPSSCSSRTEGKKYRLHIVGEVCHEAIPDEDGTVMKMNVIKGRPLDHIEIILKHGDEQVPASHHLASLRVELVVLDAKCYMEESTDWPRKEFEDHLMPVSKNSRNRMTVERGIFSLDGGRKVCTVASINQSSWKQKVRLGVMVVQDGSVRERVLEGVSSNEFYVIHERRRDATCANKDSKRQATGNSELNSNGKRVNSHSTLQPGTSYSQFSGHAQSPQKFGQHPTGKQPSYARNACSTQNCPTAPIGYVGGAVPSQSYAPNSDQGLPARVHKRLDDNHGIPSEEAYAGFMFNPPHNQGHVDLSSQNPMMGKRVHIDAALQPIASYSQFSEHVRSAQNLGQHAKGGQPSHAQNAWSTQNRPTTPIGNIRGTVPFPPQAYGPNSEGLPASDQMKLEEARGLLMDDSPDNHGGCAQNDIIKMVRKIVNELLPPALSISQGINPRYENLQGLQTQLSLFGDRLQAGHHPLEVLGNPDILLASIREVTSDAELLNCAQVFDLVTELSNLDIQLKLTSTQARQPENNGTGGAQGQPSTPQSNHLHTNSQEHTTTDDFTSAQMDINPTDDRDAEMGGHEQGNSGRVGDDDYGGGNDGGCVGDKDDDVFWGELLSNISPEMYDQNIV